MWTNSFDEEEFLRITRYVTTCEDAEWKAVVNQYSPIVMEYDPFNSKLTETITACLSGHSPEISRMQSIINLVYE